MVANKGKLDTSNTQVGAETTVQQGSRISDPIAAQPAHSAIQAEVPPMDQMELERFMNEELDVLIHEPQLEGEPSVVELEVGGIPCYAMRGIPQKLRRKYVEVLARARSAHVRHWYKQQGEATKNFQSFSSRALTYPFIVEKDPSGGKGRAWLASTLASAA